MNTRVLTKTTFIPADPAFSSAESAAITAAGNGGIVFCAAAGDDTANNDLIPTYPANYRFPNMIVVAASTQSDTLANFSNRGATTVDLAAPGSNIYSLKPTWLGSTTASVTAGATVVTAQGMTFAGITPAITATLINCGTGNSAAEFPVGVSGNIALIQRGTETFATKLINDINANALPDWWETDHFNSLGVNPAAAREHFPELLGFGGSTDGLRIGKKSQDSCEKAARSAYSRRRPVKTSAAPTTFFRLSTH